MAKLCACEVFIATFIVVGVILFFLLIIRNRYKRLCERRRYSDFSRGFRARLKELEVRSEGLGDGGFEVDFEADFDTKFGVDEGKRTAPNVE